MQIGEKNEKTAIMESREREDLQGIGCPKETVADRVQDDTYTTAHGETGSVMYVQQS